METLKDLIKFMYTDSLDPEKDNIKALFSTADKYDMQVLISNFFNLDQLTA